MQPPHSTATRPADPIVKPCDYCDQLIIWTVTVKDGRMPVDATPDDHGNILVRREAGEDRAFVIPSRPKRAAMRAHGVQLRSHHKLSCPRASEWSRRYA